MKPRTRKSAQLHGRGEIRSDAIYPIIVVMRRLGIGRSTLTTMRRQGLSVRQLGRRCTYVFGSELIEFLKTQQQ
jgi:hypothetical protein